MTKLFALLFVNRPLSAPLSKVIAPHLDYFLPVYEHGDSLPASQIEKQTRTGKHTPCHEQCRHRQSADSDRPDFRWIVSKERYPLLNDGTGNKGGQYF